jgi:hypothetical protein
MASMLENARNWRVVAGGLAAGIAGVLSFSGSTAAAEPLPAPPVPAPVTVTQTVTVAPAAVGTAPAAVGATPADPAAPAPVAAPATALATPALPALGAPATSGTLTDFFHEKNVTLEPQHPQTLTALHITLPMPSGWSQVPDPNVPDAFAVIADRTGGDGLYTSNAQVVVYKLVGDFDPREAITHGFVDAQQQSNWQATDGALTYFAGFPSSTIEGTFRENDMLLNTSRRHVIATVGPDHYLVSLAVSTSASQAVAAAPSTDAIVNGFRVTDPTQPAAAPAPVAPAAPAPAGQPETPPAPGAPAAVPALPAAPAAQPAAAAPGLSAAAIPTT